MSDLRDHLPAKGTGHYRRLIAWATTRVADPARGEVVDLDLDEETGGPVAVASFRDGSTHELPLSPVDVVDLVSGLIPSPSQRSQAPEYEMSTVGGAAVCTWCGGLVMDRSRHTRFHRSLA